MLIRHPKNPEVQDPAPERKRTILDSTHGKSSGAWWCSKRGGRWTISVILIHEDSVEYNIVQYQNQQIYHARVLCLAKIHYDTSDKHEDIGQPCSFWAKMVDTERFEPQVTGYQRGTFMDKARRVGSTTQRVGIEHDGKHLQDCLALVRPCSGLKDKEKEEAGTKERRSTSRRPSDWLIIPSKHWYVRLGWAPNTWQWSTGDPSYFVYSMYHRHHLLTNDSWPLHMLGCMLRVFKESKLVCLKMGGYLKMVEEGIGIPSGNLT